MADRFVITTRPKAVQPPVIKPFYEDEREAIAALEYAKRGAADPDEIVLVRMRDADDDSGQVLVSDVPLDRIIALGGKGDEPSEV